MLAIYQKCGNAAPAWHASVAVCNATVTVPVIEPNSLREKRASQLDLRLTKTFRRGDVTIRPGCDVYNALNSDDVITLVTTFGRNWLRPGAVLPGRLYKFNVFVNY